MYNIIHLLKCSSPALAKHFEESENSIKKLGEISVDFEKRLHTLEGEIGQRSLSRVGTLNAQSTDNVYTGEYYPFLDDESSKYALIIVDGKGAKFIRFITGTHTFLNVKIVWSNNTLTIGANPDTILDNYVVVIVGDWIDEGLGRFYEEYCKLYNKLYATEDSVYTPFEIIIESQTEFVEQKRTIDGKDYTAYFQSIKLNPSDKEVVYNPSFCPHCTQYIEYVSEISYSEIPIMDYDNYDVFNNQDITGFAISREYNKKKNTTYINLYVTKKVYELIGAGVKYKLYL